MSAVIFDLDGQDVFEHNPAKTLYVAELPDLVNPDSTDAGILQQFSDSQAPVSRETQGYIFPEKLVRDLVNNVNNVKVEGLAIRYGLAVDGALHLVFIPIENTGDGYVSRYDLAKTTYAHTISTKDPILSIPPNRA